MRPVLLATCARLPDGDEDAALLDRALLRQGLDARWAAWTDEAVAWDDAVVVLRSTWDYTAHRPGFLDWVRRLPTVHNGADVVVWNSDKTYLRDLRDAGVPDRPHRLRRARRAGRAAGRGRVRRQAVGRGRFARSRPVHAGRGRVRPRARRGAARRRSHRARPALPRRRRHRGRDGAGLPRRPVQPRDPQGPDAAERHRARPRRGGAVHRGEHHAAHPVGGGARGRRARPGRICASASAPTSSTPGSTCCPRPDGPVVIELELVEPSLFLAFADGDQAADRLAAAVAARA